MNLFEEINNDVLIQEAAENFDNIPYMKYIRRKIFLPKGKPVGRGNMCLLYSKSENASIDMISNTSTLDARNSYGYYYINPIYSGFLNGKKYIRRNMTEQKTIYENLKKNPKIKHIYPYPRKIFNPNGHDNRNIFIDLRTHLDIFDSICSKFPPVKYIKLYWNYLRNVIESYTNTPSYNYKFMLVDISQFALSSNLKENIKNPLFMIYYTNMKNLSLMKDLDIDIFFFVKNTRSFIKVNPSKCDEKSYKAFRVEMKKLFTDIKSHVDIDNTLDEENILQQDIFSNAEDKVLGDLSDIGKDTVSKKSSDKDIESINKKISDISNNMTKKVLTTDRKSVV